MNPVLSTLLILVVFALLLTGLVFLKKQNKSFTFRVVAALLLGLVFGALLQVIFGYGHEAVKLANDWMALVGSGYVRLLRMIVIPLIFVSILYAFVTQRSKNLGKMALRVLAVLMITVAISALVGALTTAGFGLSAEGLQMGSAESARASGLEQTLQNFSKTPIQQQILEIIPVNPFAAMAGQGANATLATVFFATMLAIAAIQIRKFKPDSAEFFEKIVVSLHDVVMRLVNMIMRFTPYGILALMTKVASTSNVSDITRLLKFIVASYVAILIMFVVHLLILLMFGLNPITYLKKSADALIFAFTSRSSAGTLPMTIKAQKERLGVPEGTANLAGTLGTSIGQNGCAGIYPAMLAVMIAPTLGINPLDPVFLIRLIVVTTFASFGIAGVGGGATFAALTVLSAMGFPVALAGLLIAIEPLIDMARTALNVSDSIVAGVVTAKSMNELDVNAYHSSVKEEAV
ncbi:L-cystine uptake protein TcyP [Clostridiaceae bacterium JG1575]|nr:L-cystine uptake protein TcyP [Clostridiaceae bacterium JG1575]